MSTGMKHGIAIPHGKTTAVHSWSHVSAYLSKKWTLTPSIERCRIFIMTLSPIDKTGPHLQFLAEVGMLFRSEENAKRSSKPRLRKKWSLFCLATPKTFSENEKDFSTIAADHCTL